MPLPPAQTRRSDTSAVILCGGKSSRMGRPKALLPFDGEPLILHLVRRLSHRFSDIAVVCAPDQPLPRLPATIVSDEIAHQGPVGGLYYGLRAIGTEAAFVTSCDAAFLQLPVVDSLIGQLDRENVTYDVVVPTWEGRLQPLHAVYRQSVVGTLREQLVEQRLRPVYLYDRVPTRTVSADEVRRLDPDGLSFFNLNTEADYRAALARWGALYPRIACTVELYGVARLTAGVPHVPLTLPAEALLGDALAALADRCPQLLGPVLESDAAGGTRLGSGYACNLNGAAFVRDSRTAVQTGDSLLILSSDAGG